jgi:hypothetical protein
MTRLSDIAAFIKSANAGATQLTFDIGFPDRSTFEQIVRSGVIDAAKIASLYNIDAGDVAIHHYEPASTIKITIPRATRSGGVDERDFDGVQQYPPLLGIEVGEISR